MEYEKMLLTTYEIVMNHIIVGWIFISLFIYFCWLQFARCNYAHDASCI